MRLGLGNRSYLGGEFACLGSFIPLQHSGSKILSAGVDAAMRLQYPHLSRSWLVEPFVLLGMGWTRVTLADGEQGVAGSDLTGDVLLGGGVTLGHGRLLLDARLTYRATFHDQLKTRGDQMTGDLSRWSITAYVGRTL